MYFPIFQSCHQQNRLTHIICEARGRVEDQALKLEFSNICSGGNSLCKLFPFELIIADKKTNSEGLQFADLAARPAGLAAVRPNQMNRAFQILEKKLHKNNRGEVSGFCLYPSRRYPIRSEKLQEDS